MQNKGKVYKHFPALKLVNSDDPSLNPIEVYQFIMLSLLEENENKLKGPFGKGYTFCVLKYAITSVMQ